MNAQQNPYLVPVRYGTGLSVLWLVAGGLFLLLGLIALAAGAFSLHLILGVLFTLFGVLSFFKPYAVYDAATGALYLYSPLGFQVRAYGAPKGERVYFDPAKSKVVRAMPNGAQRKVSMVGVNREDLARLIQALYAANQAPTGPVPGA